MSWSDPIDLYCERLDPSFWAEPINAWSNAGFIVAAALAFRHWQRHGGKDRSILGLIVLVALIGSGSFLFHTFATRAVSLADVMPITLFVFGYLFLALRRVLGLSIAVSLALLAAFVAVSETLSSAVPSEALNGSEAYLPPLAALTAIGLLAKDPSRRGSLLGTAAIFAGSLGFRTIDLAVCPRWPAGTHFVWHLLNAVVLYRLVVALAVSDAATMKGKIAGRGTTALGV